MYTHNRIALQLTVGTLAAISATSAWSQDLTLSGFMQFDADYGVAYDEHYSSSSQDEVTTLDFSAVGRVNFDYSQSTKSGLEYGAHFELDLYQSDGERGSFLTEWEGLTPYDDITSGDDVEFNDGYVFINSALGTIKLGDTGAAGKARNQLNVPILAQGAFAIDSFSKADNGLWWFYPSDLWVENVTLYYANSFAGIDFDASVDDGGFWVLGVGYNGQIGDVGIELGLTGSADAAYGVDIFRLAGSLQANIGGLTAGISYASFDAPSVVTDEYVAMGMSYDFGALEVGAGVETRILNFDFAKIFDPILGPVSEVFETNVFVGADYEIADGLYFAAGLGNLDGDNLFNWTDPVLGDWPRTINATASVRVEF